MASGSKPGNTVSSAEGFAVVEVLDPCRDGGWAVAGHVVADPAGNTVFGPAPLSACMAELESAVRDVSEDRDAGIPGAEGDGGEAASPRIR